MPKDTLPKPKVNLDLNSIGPDKIKPFSVRLGDRDYVLADIREIDYRVLTKARRIYVTTGDLEPCIEAMVLDEDREAFFANPMPTHILETLFTSYNEHYGIDSDAIAQAS